MSKRKKIVLISVLSVAALFLLFIGYHYIKYLQATSRMTELSVDLEKRITEWEKKEYKRQPLFGPVVKGNAAEFYQEAEEKVEDAYKSDIQLWYPIEYPSRPISPEVQSYYEKNKPIIEIVRKGVRADTYKSLLNLRKDFQAKTPNLVNPRSIGHLMVLQARELDNAGQTSEAIKELCDIIQFGDDYFYYGSLIPAMVGIAVSAICEEEIHRFIVSGKLTEPQLNDLQRYLKVLIDSYPTMQDTWEGEIMICEFRLKGRAENSGFLWRKKELLSNQIWINRTGFIDAINDYAVSRDEVRMAISLPYYQAKEEIEKYGDIEKLDNPFRRLIISNLRGSINSYRDSLTLRKGLYILAALQIYKIRRGAYPETLAALAPGIIPEVPLDPFSDKPFIYRLDENGKAILYSVGMNLNDDNGDRNNDRLIAPYLYGNERK